MSNNEKVLYIAEQCRQAGCTLAGAAGIIANIEAESAFKPHNLQDTHNTLLGVSDEDYTAQVDAGARNFIDDAGYGLAQWTAGSRKEKMLRYHRAKCKSIGDFQTQVDFLLQEIREYKRAWDVCTQSNDAYQCGHEVCMYYEIPANKASKAKQRGQRAVVWYRFLLSSMNNESTVPQAAQEGSETDAANTGKITLRTIDENIDGWPEVWLLQALLKVRGYPVLINGLFTADLVGKVKVFQASAGLKADGIVGPLTWAKLLSF